MKRDFLIPSYDFVLEELSQEQQDLLFCYFRPNQFSPKRLICIIFADKQLTSGRIEWLEDQRVHPLFWDCLLELV